MSVTLTVRVSDTTCVVFFKRFKARGRFYSGSVTMRRTWAGWWPVSRDLDPSPGRLGWLGVIRECQRLCRL